MSIKSLMKNMLHSAVNLVFTRINYSIQFKYQVYTKIQIDMNLSDKTGILTHWDFQDTRTWSLYICHLPSLIAEAFRKQFFSRNLCWRPTWQLLAHLKKNWGKIFISYFLAFSMNSEHWTKLIFHVSKIHSDWKSI